VQQIRENREAESHARQVILATLGLTLSLLVEVSHNPSSLSSPEEVVSLGLSFCNLTELPETISLFSGLVSLNLSNNNLSYLPNALGSLPLLATLDISGNPLTTLPRSLYEKEDLDLHLKNCPKELLREIATIAGGGEADGEDAMELEEEIPRDPPPSAVSLALDSSRQQPNSSRVMRQVMLEHVGLRTPFQLPVPVPSVDALAALIKAHLKLEALPELEYYDNTRAEYCPLDSLAFLPQNKVSVLRVSSEPQSFWMWPQRDSSSWLPLPTRPGSGSPLKQLWLPVRENGSVRDVEAHTRLVTLLMGAFFDINRVKTAHAVHCPDLLERFGAFRTTLLNQRKGTNVAVISSPSWKAKADAGQRALVWIQLEEYTRKFPWNFSLRPPVIPVYYGVRDGEDPWALCSGGFPKDSAGNFGSGYYFTTTPAQAVKAAKDTPQGKAVIVGCVIPGSAYPVTEIPKGPSSLMGRPCVSGYQSHFSVTSPSTGLPVTATTSNPHLNGDVLVTFSEAQAVPLFVLYI